MTGSRGFIQELAGRMVFLVGSPRSGTTWLQRMLEARPDVRTGPESWAFDHLLCPQLRAWKGMVNRPPGDRVAVGLGCFLTDREFRDLFDQYASELLKRVIGVLGPGQLYLEKTPSNALFIEEILDLVPGSRFIHVVRDPRDVVCSLLAASQTWGKSWAPSTAGRAARFWVEHVEAVAEAHGRLPEVRLFETRYEALVADPEAELKRVSAFLGLGADVSWVERAVQRTALENLKRENQVPFPVGGELAARTDAMQEPKGFYRRGAVGGWKKELSLLQLLQVWKVARRWMRRYGYGWA